MTGLLAVLQGEGSGMAGEDRGRGWRVGARFLRVGALLGVVLASALALPRPAAAASVGAGAFTLKTNDNNATLTEGADYEYGRDSTDIDEGNRLLIKTTTPVTVSMKDSAAGPTSDRITIDPGAGKAADVTLDGVKISYTSMSPYSSSRRAGKSPIDIASGDVTLKLANGSKNELVSVNRDDPGTAYYAGAAVHVAHGSSLRIEGTGELNAQIQANGIEVESSCVGGNKNEVSGAIEIADGRIDLSVSSLTTAYAAVMGAGSYGASSGVTISGGNVSVSVNVINANAAAIGAGFNTSSCPVRISGGVLNVASNASGYNYGSAIGGGYLSSSDVTISGGKIKVAYSGTRGVHGNPIGAGASADGQSHKLSITGGKFANANVQANSVYGAGVADGCAVVQNTDSDSGKYPYMVKSRAGDLLVTGGTFGVDYTYWDHDLTVITETPLTITMSASADDQITYVDENDKQRSVKGTKADRIVIKTDESKIAHVTLNGVAIQEEEQFEWALQTLEGKANITLAAGSMNILISGDGAAGLDVGAGGVELDGTGGLIAVGGDSAAGIGSSDHRTRAGDITISGGVITATSKGEGGAGIGCGQGSSAGTISISGGAIKAVPGENAQAIGAGNGSSPAAVNITGGVFADTSAGAVTDNAVYGVKPAEGYLAYANGDESTTTSYPVAVGKDPKLTLKNGISAIYGATRLKASDIIESVTLGESATTGTALDELQGISYAYCASSDAGDIEWTDGLPSEVGSYDLKVTFGPRVVGDVQYAGVTKTGSLTVKKIASSVTATAYKGDVATSDFTYGDTIAVKATVSATGGAASGQRPAPVAPSQRQMALYYDADGDGVIDAGEPQLSQAVNADADGTYVMTYSTTDKKLPVGSNIKLIAKFVGDGNQDDAQAPVTVSLARKELTASLAGDASKEYDGTAALPDDGHTVAVKLEGVVDGDKVSATAATLAFSGKDVGTKGITATGVSLEGDAADYYALKGAGSDGKLAALSGVVTSGISPRMVEIVWSGYEGRVFGDDKTVTATVNNAVEGDKVNVTVEGGGETTVGSHTATATGLTGASAANYALPTDDALKRVYTIAQSGSVIENLKTLNGDTETSDFTYGDTVTVTGTVKATGAAAQSEGDEGAASKRRAGQDEQPVNKVALFYGETQLTEWVDLSEAGAFSLGYNTLDGKVRPADAITLTVKYRGNANQVDAERSVTISLAKATTSLTVTADRTELSGGGKVRLTVASSGLPEGADITVTCDDGSIKLADNKDGTYSATLPNKNATYKFTAAYAGDDNHKPASASVSVEVARSGGSGGGGSAVVNLSHPVEVAPSEGGTTTVEPKSAKPGQEVTVTAKPDAGREVGSVAVTDSSGKPVEVEPGKDANAWTFDMPRGGATVSVVYIPVFHDVDYGSWYARAVRFVVTKGLMLGYGDTGLFGVGHALTRGELATILWRHATDPSGDLDTSGSVNATGMPDVADGAFYTEAANWAVENGIINGYDLGGGKRAFGPNDPVTLEQMVAVIGNLTADKGEVSGADIGVLDRYADKAGVSAWATKSVAWATEVGLVNGCDLGDTREIRSTERVARERAAGVLFNAFEKGLME